MKKNFIFSFLFLVLLGCKNNGMKIKVYYNTPGEWPDIGRTVDFIKNGHYEFIQIYDFDDFGIEYEKLELNDADVEEVNINNIIGLSTLCAETLFEILGENGEIVFSYLYFENEEYFLNTKDYTVCHLSGDLKKLSKKVIHRALVDNNVEG